MQLSFHRPVLGDAHERLQPFQSESGTTYSAQRQLMRREAAMLADARGACFEISPSEGVLEPWGLVAVKVSIHSNMWGLYDDVLVADVMGLEPQRIVMRAGIVGSPIRLHDATLGVSNITDPPTLSWAPVPSGSGPAKKTIRVLNRGPAPARLTWQVLQAADPERPLAATLSEAGGEGGALSLGLAVAEPLPLDGAAFRVSPETDMLPPGGEKRFEVLFVGEGDQGSGETAFEALLSAVLLHPAQMPLPGGGSSDAHPPLRLQLKGDSVTPRLSMSERSKVKFKVSPTMAKDDPAYTRYLTMTNNSSTTLEFSLAIPLPFLLKEAQCSVAQFAIMGQAVVDETAKFVLPPDSSLRAVINYMPAKKRRRQDGDGADGADGDDARSVVSTSRTATSTADTIGDDVDMALASTAKLEQLLKITFANGTVQTFPLLAVTTTPYLELSPPPVHGTPSLPFGVTHVSHTPTRELEIWNPTEIEAKWSIIHVPYKPPAANSAAGARAKAAALAGEVLPTDDPTAFEFSEREGTLAPRGGVQPVHYPLWVKFKPKAAGLYRSTYNVKVRAGMTAKLELTAEATLREEDWDVAYADKHLRLMQPGEIS